MPNALQPSDGGSVQPRVSSARRDGARRTIEPVSVPRVSTGNVGVRGVGWPKPKVKQPAVDTRSELMELAAQKEFTVWRRGALQRESERMSAELGELNGRRLKLAFTCVLLALATLMLPWFGMSGWEHITTCTWAGLCLCPALLAYPLLACGDQWDNVSACLLLAGYLGTLWHGDFSKPLGSGPCAFLAVSLVRSTALVGMHPEGSCGDALIDFFPSTAQGF
eukprot:TRINITY_DN20425_c0_g1_i1.p1 TRINITY_DN20425_c0_g1~~TRINITY_DN20425_c0_g1_i1.p1  ORF type:complete len:222 (+),score=44.71 TRINITY_DN20425_c0_g1_i1:140-805(+)